MEGNKFSWHSTLHNTWDHPGLAGGFGGVQQADMMYGAGPRDMTGAQYGPGGSIVDTNEAFNVAVSFPEGPGGSLVDMVVMLWQDGKDDAIEWRVNKPRADSGRSPPLNCEDSGCDNCFSKPGCVYQQDDLNTFGQWLSEGMTPLATYWGGSETWLDGVLPGEQGGCQLGAQGQPGTENLGDYASGGGCGGWYSIGGWTVEPIQNAVSDWSSYFAAMDANPVIPQHLAPTPPPTPPVPPPSPPTPTPVPPTPAPSGCPGGSLSACIALCPSSPASVYQICVNSCLDRCPGSIIA